MLNLNSNITLYNQKKKQSFYPLLEAEDNTIPEGETGGIFSGIIDGFKSAGMAVGGAVKYVYTKIKNIEERLESSSNRFVRWIPTIIKLAIAVITIKFMWDKFNSGESSTTPATPPKSAEDKPKETPQADKSTDTKSAGGGKGGKETPAQSTNGYVSTNMIRDGKLDDNPSYNPWGPKDTELLSRMEHRGKKGNNNIKTGELLDYIKNHKMTIATAKELLNNPKKYHMDDEYGGFANLVKTAGYGSQFGDYKKAFYGLAKTPAQESLDFSFINTYLDSMSIISETVEKIEKHAPAGYKSGMELEGLKGRGEKLGNSVISRAKSVSIDLLNDSEFIAFAKKNNPDMLNTVRKFVSAVKKDDSSFSTKKK